MNKWSGLFFSFLVFSLYALEPAKETEVCMQEEGVDGLAAKVNAELISLRAALSSLYAKAFEVIHQEEECQKLLQQVQGIKTSIQVLESQWKEQVVQEAKKEEDAYALWDQE